MKPNVRISPDSKTNKLKIIQDILNKIDVSKNIVITSHKSPDGDSIGSSMGMYNFLKGMGKEVVVCHPDPFPSFLAWVEGVDSIVDFESQSEKVTELIEKADLVFALDYNHPSRLGKEMSVCLTNKKSDLVMIDHHTHPDSFVSLMFSDDKRCSTAEMVYDLIKFSGVKMNATIGTPLYLGLMTDTGSFRFPSVTPNTHRVVADLIESGVVHSKIHENVFDQNTLSQLKLKSFAINQKLEILEEGRAAIISLTESELLAHDYKKGDTEGLVSTALSIQGVQMAVFLAEKEGKIKMSFRSKGIVEVNTLAQENFEGGGHIFAAGGISFVSMEESLTKLKNAIHQLLN